MLCYDYADDGWKCGICAETNCGACTKFRAQPRNGIERVRTCVQCLVLRTADLQPGILVDWQRDASADRCPCGTVFTVLSRRHHCRCCGRVLCAACTQARARIPLWGHQRAVRVCDDCLAHWAHLVHPTDGAVYLWGLAHTFVQVIKGSAALAVFPHAMGATSALYETPKRRCEGG